MSAVVLDYQNAFHSVSRLAKEGENFLLKLLPKPFQQIILGLLVSFISTKVLASLEN